MVQRPGAAIQLCLSAGALLFGHTNSPPLFALAERGAGGGESV